MAESCALILGFQLKVKRGALTETGFFQSSLHADGRLGELVEWHLNLGVILNSQ